MTGGRLALAPRDLHRLTGVNGTALGDFIPAANPVRFCNPSRLTQERPMTSSTRLAVTATLAAGLSWFQDAMPCGIASFV